MRIATQMGLIALCQIVDLGFRRGDESGQVRRGAERSCYKFSGLAELDS